MYSPTLEYYRQSQYYEIIKNLTLDVFYRISYISYRISSQKIRNWSITAKINLKRVIYEV